MAEKMYAAARLKPKIVAETLTKKCNAISAAGDGATGRGPALSHNKTGMPRVWH